jgi:hypothetical protein
MKYVYITWAVLVFLIVFIKDGLSYDNLTHVAILVFFFATFVFYQKFQKENVIKNPKYFFITRCVLFAAIVEGCYMISKPVLSSLQIVAGMSLGQMLHNYSIDLLFTIPAYFLIFYVIWRLINKYEYGFWEFVILIALGQALGDGSRTFLLNPALLLFLPYVMINYHAMNVVSYLKIRNMLPPERLKNIWRFIIPIILIPATYLFSGLIIYTVAAIFKLK